MSEQSNMTYRLAINGFGRIGRSVVRALHARPALLQTLELTAINELADSDTVVHLARYDSTHGRFPGSVRYDGKQLLINETPARLLSEAHISTLPWRELAIDLVLECTGAFADRATAQQHLTSGASKVLLSQPGEPSVDATIVRGVNHDTLRPDHQIVSAGSCTTNALCPVLDVLHKSFGIEAGTVTTVHSAMNDQPVLDAYHHTDLRKTRAAFHSIIPVETGLAIGVPRILPELEGKLTAHALRVPTLNVSAMDVTVQTAHPATAAAVNEALAEAANGALQGILGYTTEPLASCDFNGEICSGVVDASQTQVSGQHLLKVLIWFDNEWAYANRLLDIAQQLSRFAQSPT